MIWDSQKIKEFNLQFEGKDVGEILRFVKQRFKRIGMLTAFGYSGIALIDFIREIMPEVEIFFIDTRKHFLETLEIRDFYRDEIGLNIITIQSRLSEDEIEIIYGTNLHEKDPDLCCKIRKVDPLLEVLPQKDVWISALRRGQSPTRQKLNILEKDGRNMLKIYPLITWNGEQTWRYIKTRNLKYNPLHDKNYPSIGCYCCTTQVREGKDERSGRWTTIPKLECGIHKHNRESATKEH